MKWDLAVTGCCLQPLFLILLIRYRCDVYVPDIPLLSQIGSKELSKLAQPRSGEQRQDRQPVSLIPDDMGPWLPVFFIAPAPGPDRGRENHFDVGRAVGLPPRRHRDLASCRNGAADRISIKIA